jgi:GR25 family glycosyltransferase involved in LPS biosynthesis
MGLNIFKGKNKMIKYYILSLLRADRKHIVENNIQKFPCFEVIKSINGYDVDETLRAFKASGLVYNRLHYPTYGTLANFLTKYNAIKHQIENNIPFMCFIEDDLELNDGFVSHIEDCISLFTPDIDVIRLALLGDGYVTSLNGAINIKNNIDKKGIVCNIDNQIRFHSGNELYYPNSPWKLLVPCNKGDCLKTSEISIADLMNRINSKWILDNGVKS